MIIENTYFSNPYIVPEVFENCLKIWLSYWASLTSFEMSKFGVIHVQKVSSSIMIIIFWDFLTLYQIFFPSQGKQNVIFSTMHVIYESPHLLPKDLKQEIRKYQKNLETLWKYLAWKC